MSRIMIHGASLFNGQDTVGFLAATKEEVNEKVADWCRYNWDDIFRRKAVKPEVPELDTDVIEQYFAEAEHKGLGCDFWEAETTLDDLKAIVKKVELSIEQESIGPRP